MKSLSRWFMLLVLISTLALVGCEGDDGDDGAAGPPGPEGPAGPPGPGFELPEGEYVGISVCASCHGGTAIGEAYAESAHANQGSHTVSTCATACHNPLGDNTEISSAFGHYSPSVVGCESCHGAGSGHFGVGEIPIPAPGTQECSACHSTLPGGHIERHPFADEIGERFATSRHANQNARTGFCSSCHSHEGGVALLSMDRKTSIQGLVSGYNETTVPDVYLLPTGSDTIEGVMKKNCATCHDPHATGLRGDGDITAKMLGETGTTTEEGTVVYSAEFNLCTACHMVDLDETKIGTANAGHLLFDYELSDRYVDINLQDAATGTYEMFEFEVPGQTREVFASAVFYHDGASGDGRTFADTHFGGDLSSQLVDFDGSTDVVTLEGYNINAGNENACTICHDPHTGGKMLAEASGTFTEGFVDSNENAAVGYAEGLGNFHTEYQGTASYRQTGCTPCHTGDTSYSELIEGLPLADIGDEWAVLGCRGCHDLAQANAAPGDNNEEAFAQVKQLPADYVFEFDSGVVVDAADMGDNQICFECHKGRSGVKDGAFDETTTRVYDVSYFHYAPSFATVLGDDSGMFPTYEGKTYAGTFVHGGGLAGAESVNYGCVDCHDVHNTNGNDAMTNKMTTDANCVGCHGAGGFADAQDLKDRTVAYGERLRDTIVAEYNARFEPDIDEDGFHDIMAARTSGSEIGANDLAVAANIYKILNYEDGSPDGTEHGHGGSWAHNSKLARQLQYDAIEDLGGDLTGLERP